MTGCNIQKNQFIRALLFVLTSDLDRIASVLKVDEIHALDHSARVNVETGDDTLCQH